MPKSIRAAVVSIAATIVAVATTTSAALAQDTAQVPTPPTSTAPATRVDEIVERFVNANANRDHVMVVAHRGSWWDDGKIVLAENSISAIDRAVGIGAEMVELDVQKTSDGAYVILHDKTLDRTTTCQGTVAETTLDAVRACHLVIEGTGEETAEVVPTLEEAFKAIDGRILMNVDIKLGVEELANVMRIAADMGVPTSWSSRTAPAPPTRSRPRAPRFRRSARRSCSCRSSTTARSPSWPTSPQPTTPFRPRRSRS